MPGERPVRGGTADPPPGWPLGLLAATGQTLEDLAYCGSAEVVFVRYPRGASAAELLDGVVARALTAGFVVARLPVGTGAAFDELESLLREALRVIGAAETSRARRGLAALFDVFASRHGRAAPQEMDERLGAAHLDGELATLARLWIEGRGGRAEHARLEGWIAGTELGRAAAPEARDGALPALSARTAKRVLVEVTRVVRALGWRGTLLVVEGAEAMASLPPARRQAAYTVLRELLDNADGGRGMTAALVVVAGSTSLFTGPRSIGSLPPLAARVLPDETRGDAAGGADHRPRTAPHQPLLDVISVDLAVRGLTAPEPHVPSGEAGALGDVVRAMRGLPPLHGARAASVGQARIDAAVDALFQHSRVDGSVFALLTGAYGTGKSHVLAHVAERALAESRPVLRLSLERLDADLGHPERHLRRLLEQSTVPLRRGGGAPSRSPLELCAEWTLSPTRRAELERALRLLAVDDGDAAEAAQRALAMLERPGAQPAAVLQAYLGAQDLGSKAPGPAARRDAYGRLLLWLALIEALEGASCPVLLIDEAENLYRGGASRPERRTALRALSFYCGGALPRAAVVLAITPDALDELRAEAPTLLDDVAEQRTLLAWEDASMLCRRLRRARPLPVPQLGPKERAELAERVRGIHEAARGARADGGWSAFVAQLATTAATPRAVVRRAAERLEVAHWHASFSATAARRAGDRGDARPGRRPR